MKKVVGTEEDIGVVVKGIVVAEFFTCVDGVIVTMVVSEVDEEDEEKLRLGVCVPLVVPEGAEIEVGDCKDNCIEALGPANIVSVVEIVSERPEVVEGWRIVGIVTAAVLSGTTEEIRG